MVNSSTTMKGDALEDEGCGRVYVTVATPTNNNQAGRDENHRHDDDKESSLPLSSDGITLSTLFTYADTKDKIDLTIGVFCAALLGVALPMSSILIGQAIDAFVPLNRSEVNRISLYYIFLAVVMAVTTYGSNAFFERSAERQMRRFRVACLNAMLRQDLAWYDLNDGKVGNLTARLASDVQQIQEGIGEKLAQVIQFSIQFLAGYGIGLYKGWNLTLGMMTVFPLVVASLTFVMKKGKTAAVASRKFQAEGGAIAEEALSSMRTLSSLNAQDFIAKKYNAVVNEAKHINISAFKLMSFGLGILFSSIWMTYAIGFYLGGYLVSQQNGTIQTPGDVMTTFYAILLGTIAAGQISPNLTAVAQAKGSAVQLFEVINREPKIKEEEKDENPIIRKTSCGEIIVKNVMFCYPSRPVARVLNDVSFTIRRGQVIALCGRSGSGKSSIAKLIMRFYDIKKGEILYDGQPLHELPLQWYRKQIGLVSQEPILFSTTIFENISNGKGLLIENEDESSRQEEVEKAAKMANIHETIQNLPNGYQTMVGEGGSTLSGGQKQVGG